MKIYGPTKIERQIRETETDNISGLGNDIPKNKGWRILTILIYKKNMIKISA